jgi:hypothetical protein
MSETHGLKPGYIATLFSYKRLKKPINGAIDLCSSQKTGERGLQSKTTQLYLAREWLII